MSKVRKPSSTKLLDPAAIRRALAAQAPDARFDGPAAIPLEPLSAEAWAARQPTVPPAILANADPDPIPVPPRRLVRATPLPPRRKPKE